MYYLSSDINLKCQNSIMSHRALIINTLMIKVVSERLRNKLNIQKVSQNIGFNSSSLTFQNLAEIALSSEFLAVA